MIEIVVTYEKSKVVEVPEYLAKILVRDGTSEEFDEWVAEQANTAMGEEPFRWCGTTAFDDDNSEVVYDVS